MRACLTAGLLLLAVPTFALAQAGAEEKLAACTAGLDVDAITARADAYAASRNYEAHIAELCAAGDSAGAAAFHKEVQAEVNAKDPDAARLMACLEEALGKEAVDPGDLCAP